MFPNSLNEPSDQKLSELVRHAGQEIQFANEQGNQWKADFFYSLGRYSERKRDIGMGHKKSNDGHAWGTKRLFGENWLRISFDCVLVARSRVSNSAFNIPYPPLAYIFWTAWTWVPLLPLVASKIYHNYKKVEQIVIEWSVFGGYFWSLLGSGAEFI